MTEHLRCPNCDGKAAVYDYGFTRFVIRCTRCREVSTVPCYLIRDAWKDWDNQHFAPLLKPATETAPNPLTHIEREKKTGTYEAGFDAGKEAAAAVLESIYQEYSANGELILTKTIKDYIICRLRSAASNPDSR